MSDSTDAMARVGLRGAWLSWAAFAGVCGSLLFAGGAVVRFELHAQHQERRLDATDRAIERLDGRREDAGQSLTEIKGELKAIRQRLDRIENKLDGKH